MGRSGNLFKNLVAGVKAFKSPSKKKPEKDKSASNPDKNHLRKGNKEKCLWSVGKSASRNRDSFAPEAACVDVPERESTKVENNYVKDVPITDQSFTTELDHRPRGLIKSENASLTEFGPRDVAEQEQQAAIKIQAAYRPYLASNQALPALRALVRLQALVRGYMVRKHASAALRCMRALVKLQALARGHRVRASELGQFVQKHLQQTQQRRNLVENEVSSMVPVQSVRAKAESKRDEVVKRQRALVCAFSEQLNKCETKQNHSPTIDFQPDKSHWSWVWLERWMAAHPWGHPSVDTKEEYSKEGMVYRADAEQTAMSCGRDASSLHTPVPSSNIENLCSSDSLDDFISHSQSSPSAMDQEAIPYKVQMSEDCRHSPSDLKTAQPEPKSETESYNLETNEAIERPLLSPTPPPLPAPPNTKRPKPVIAHQTRSNKGKLAAISVHTPHEMSRTMEAVQETSSARGAQQLSDTCTSTLAAHLKPMDLTRSPMEDSIPAASAHLSSGISTTQSTPQSHLDSTLDWVQLPATTTSTTRDDADEVWNANNHISMPITEPSDSEPFLASQPPFSPTTPSELLESPQLRPSLSPTTSSEVLVLPTHTQAIACSPSSQDAIHDNISNGVYRHFENGSMDSTLSMMEKTNGSDEDEVTENSVRCDSVDLKDHLPEKDMNVEGPESDSIDCKSGDAFVELVGEKSTEVSSSKNRSPVSRQGQYTETVSPPLPKYMTTTKSSEAKIRTLTDPKQKSDSPKQKNDSPTTRFNASKQKLADSPKLKVESPKQKEDSPKQRLDFPKQKLVSPEQKEDHAVKRRHSLSALEGKGSATRSKSNLTAKVNWHL